MFATFYYAKSYPQFVNQANLVSCQKIWQLRFSSKLINILFLRLLLDSLLTISYGFYSFNFLHSMHIRSGWKKVKLSFTKFFLQKKKREISLPNRAADEAVYAWKMLLLSLLIGLTRHTYTQSSTKLIPDVMAVDHRYIISQSTFTNY